MLRAKPNVLIVATRHGLVLANAGIDQSNLERRRPRPARAAAARGSRCQRAAPQGAARRAFPRRHRRHHLRQRRPRLAARHGRARHRRGRRAVAVDRRGEKDLSGRPLEVTEVGFADAVAAAAVLAMGEAAEGRPAALVRGLDWSAPARPAGGAGAARGRGPVPMSAPAAARHAMSRCPAAVGGAKLSLGPGAAAAASGSPSSSTPATTSSTWACTSRPTSTPRSTRWPASSTRRPAGAGATRPGPSCSALAELGGPTWFKLGDGDLATHVERTRRLRGRRDADRHHARISPASSASPRASCP